MHRINSSGATEMLFDNSTYVSTAFSEPSSSAQYNYSSIQHSSYDAQSTGTTGQATSHHGNTSNIQADQTVSTYDVICRSDDLSDLSTGEEMYHQVLEQKSQGEEETYHVLGEVEVSVHKIPSQTDA